MSASSLSTVFVPQSTVIAPPNHDAPVLQSARNTRLGAASHSAPFVKGDKGECEMIMVMLMVVMKTPVILGRGVRGVRGDGRKS